jgi:hypothetical protein
MSWEKICLIFSPTPGNYNQRKGGTMVTVGIKVKKIKGVETPIRDKLGRIFRRIFPTANDVCEVCGNACRRNNRGQIVKFCSKEHRRLRHRGLEIAK